MCICMHGERDMRGGIIYSHINFYLFVSEKLALEVTFLVRETFLLAGGPVLGACSTYLLNPKPKFGRKVPS